MQSRGVLHRGGLTLDDLARLKEGGEGAEEMSKTRGKQGRMREGDGVHLRHLWVCVGRHPLFPVSVCETVKEGHGSSEVEETDVGRDDRQAWRSVPA